MAIILFSMGTMKLLEVQPDPQGLWVGIGCKRGTSKQLIKMAVEMVCHSNNLAKNAIAGVATIDHKAEEWGLVAFCQEYNLPLKTFPAEVLGKVVVETGSKFVAKTVGTPSVSEAAAIMAANGVLLVTKQIFKSEQLGAVTVAIAL